MKIKALGNHVKAFNQHRARIEILNEELIKKIEGLPENPRIERLGKNCYSISSKDLGTVNWTPFYHDFTHQYKFLRAVIENYDMNQIESIFTEILTKGHYRLNKTISTGDSYTFTSKDTYRFHPDVINFLKEKL